MRIIAKSTLIRFCEQAGCEDALEPLMRWFRTVSSAQYQNANDVKKQFGSADPVGNTRIVFNIGGNKYRLIVAFQYGAQVCYIKWVGTHKAYDKIDAATVELEL